MKIGIDVDDVVATFMEHYLKFHNLINNGYEVIFSGEIYGGKTKSTICKDKWISLIVEDNVIYALNCAQEDIKVFLLDKPWNKKYKHHKNIVKVKDWDEIIDKLK